MTLRFLSANALQCCRLISPFELSRGDIVSVGNNIFVVKGVKTVTDKAVTVYSCPLFADKTIATMYVDKRVIKAGTMCKFYGKGII